MSPPVPHSILFDFDGTLVDSAPSILDGLGRALERTGTRASVALTPALIGPPLRKTLATLAGRDDPALIDTLAAAFRNEYDSTGYKLTAVYPGVPAMLETFCRRGIALHIVTNKRIKPTRLILDYFGWTPWFSGIYALDSFEPAAPDKTALVREVLRRHALPAEHTWMVGDSAEDRQSALANGLYFFAATWGYGSAAADLGEAGLAEPDALLAAAERAITPSGSPAPAG